MANETNEEKLKKSLKEKFTAHHLIKVFRDDFQSLFKEGPVEFVLRWYRRLKRLKSIKLFLKLATKKLIDLLPAFFRKKLLVNRLKKKNLQFEDIHIVDKDVVEPLAAKLSVVINTKNSPDFFEEILEKYNHQVGFKKVEIIIVDSGSTDDTLEIVRRQGCKLIEIKPEEFRHGRSRNIGIEAANGDFIINTVSDAIPATLDLAYKVAIKLQDNQAAAVSVRQIPRFDADLFAVWSFWQHYTYIFEGLPTDLWIENVKNLNKLSDFEKRKIAIIDDVFVMHKASVIKKQKYDNDIRYAEDLLLSLSYIKQGVKIGFLQSEAVIHSHTRPAEYFFKRYFVDSNVLHEVFNSVPNNIQQKNFQTDKETTSNNLYSLIAAVKNKVVSLKEDGAWLDKYTDFFPGAKLNKKLEENWELIFDLIYAKFEEFLTFRESSLEGHTDVKLRVAAMVGGSMLSEYFTRYNLKKDLTQELTRFKEFMEKGI